MRQFWVKSFTICSEGGQHPAKKSSKAQFSRFGSSMWQQPNLVHAASLGEKLNNFLKGWSTPREKKFKSTFFQFLGVPCDNNQILHMQKFCVKTHNLLRGWPTPHQKRIESTVLWGFGFPCDKNQILITQKFWVKSSTFYSKSGQSLVERSSKANFLKFGNSLWQESNLEQESDLVYTKILWQFAQEVVNQQFIRVTNGTTNYLP